jgi:membrane protease YdiL (CAAX protease family)
MIARRRASSSGSIPVATPGASYTPASAADRAEADSRGRLGVYFLLVFGFSWAAWLPVAAAARGMITLPASSTLDLLGAFSPTLVALALTFRSGGLRGVRALLGRLRRWKVAPGWYAFALATPAALSLLTTGIHILLGGQSPDFAHPPVLALYPAPLEAFGAGPWPFLPFIFLQQLLLGSAMGEEPGWRGYALPRLQARWTALASSLVLGVLWGLWHLPRLLAGDSPVASSLGWLLLGIIPWAVLYTWLYNGTGASLLLPLLLHAATSTTGLFLAVPDAHPLIAPALAWAVAAVLLCADPRLRGTRRAREGGAAEPGRAAGA